MANPETAEMGKITVLKGRAKIKICPHLNHGMMHSSRHPCLALGLRHRVMLPRVRDHSHHNMMTVFFDYQRSRTQYPYRPPLPYSANGSYRTQSPNRNQSQFRTYSPGRNTYVRFRSPPPTRYPGRLLSPRNPQQRASRSDGRQFNVPPRDKIMNW